MNDVLTPAPPTTATAQAPRRRRRRWVVVLAIVLVVALAGSGIGMLVAVGRYAPLDNLYSLGVRGGSFDRAGVLLTYEHGKEFSYTFDLANRGSWGVTITEVVLTRPAGPALRAPVEQLEVRMAPVSNRLAQRRSVPFQPFSLGPGEFRMITIRARFWDCAELDPSGDSMSFQTERVKFRVLGIPRSMDVRLNDKIVVRGMDVASCPAWAQEEARGR